MCNVPFGARVVDLKVRVRAIDGVDPDPMCITHGDEMSLIAWFLQRRTQFVIVLFPRIWYSVVATSNCLLGSVF